MTSRIKQIHLDCLEKLKSIPETFKYINVWDDQIDQMLLGDTYSFAYPAAFIAFNTGVAMQLGMGITSYPNCEIAIHFSNFVLDGLNDSMEQNLNIFDIRDLVQEKFNGANISYCSNLRPKEDKLDFKHKGVYKYILSFTCNFKDVKGSQTDPDLKLFGYLANPTFDLNIYRMWQSGGSYVSIIQDEEKYFSSPGEDTYVFQNGDIYVFSDGTYVLFANLVSYRGDLYMCKNSNSDLLFNSENWIKISIWMPKVKYSIDSTVLHSNEIYRCTNENEDLLFNPDNWLTIIKH